MAKSLKGFQHRCVWFRNVQFFLLVSLVTLSLSGHLGRVALGSDGSHRLSKSETDQPMALSLNSEIYRLSSDAKVNLSGIGMSLGARADLSQRFVAGLSLGQAYAPDDGAAVYTAFVINFWYDPFASLRPREQSIFDDGWLVLVKKQVQPVRLLVGASLVQFYLNGVSGVVSASGFGLETRIESNMWSIMEPLFPSFESLQALDLVIGFAADRLSSDSLPLIRNRLLIGANLRF